ncbi:MAG: DUF3516 domain-containing protein [Polyangiaceae bacterium]
MPPRPPLDARLEGSSSGLTDDELLERFLGYVAERGLSLYPAQEEAVLELMTGKNVILATPTGSGKSLVAHAFVYRTLAHGGRAFYTCPIKALVSEKFFALIDDFGADKVGMMTGDATVNPTAPIIVCTAEIVSSMALRAGVDAGIDGVVMDEFHYYADRDRGAAWHIPLLLLTRTRFLLMSATLGDATPFIERLETLTKHKTALVESATRPVPLDFEYSEVPLGEKVRDLVEKGKAPVYIVGFTQRSCAEEAQNLMSEDFCSKEQKRAIAEALDGSRWDSPYGKEIQRFVRHGIGLHHAGLLPKYRLTVEKLAQEGLLKVICGTDTLGVGVNIPIRTVLFTKLCKFDGEKTALLTVREFQQIAGRAGRKGFDDRGSVVAQAPEHVIENIKIDSKKNSDPKKYKKLQRAKPPDRGYVHWDKATFERLVSSKAEPLVARFQIHHGMLVDLLENPTTGKHGGYGAFLDLIDKAHVTPREKKDMRKLAPVLFRSLRGAGLVTLVPREGRAGMRAILATGLQRDFSVMHALALYLVELCEALFASMNDNPNYALDVVSAVEAIVESPRAILEKQTDKLKSEKLAELKAAGVEYEERMKELEKVEHPKPNAEMMYATFNAFAEKHPWVARENVRPKSIARDMYERQATFDELVREWDLARIEGVLLRYLTEIVKTLDQTVPDGFKDETLRDVAEFLRIEVRSVDSSLLDEWEDRQLGGARDRPERPQRRRGLADDPKALSVRVRRDLHKLVRVLGAKDWQGIADCIHPESELDAKAIEAAAKAFFESHGVWVTGVEARRTDLTRIESIGDALYRATQTLVDEEGPSDAVIECVVDVTEEPLDHEPLIRVSRIDV